MDRLNLLFQRLQSGLGHLPGVEYCGELPKRRDSIELPALIIELVELVPDTDPGTDQLALMSHWAVRVITSNEAHDSASWGLVQAVLFWLFMHPPTDIDIGPVQLKQASQDHFSPDYPGHRVWLVEWQQSLRVGADVWDGTGVIPSELVLRGLGAFDETMDDPTQDPPQDPEDTTDKPSGDHNA